MGLARRNGHWYLYRSVRKDGKVTSEYRGSGDIALWDWSIGHEERTRADEDRRERLEAEAEDRRLDDALAALTERAEAMAHAELVAAGYHQVDRKWRKRRARQD
jgi:hypothetical protein